MTRTLSEWGIIAEIISAIVVTVSLVFVGLQVRDNTIASRAATYQATIAFDFSFLSNIGSDPDTARVFYAFRDDPESLTGDEYLQGHALVTAVVRHLENPYLQNQAGMLSDEGWRSREPLVRGFVRTPGFERVLRGPSGGLFGGSFSDYATQLRAESDQ